ncbi:EmrB/QacA subfamily drug resistance transporter [Salirhabdus euzebyi]|uniref:EmrB/QacA subfamily drug resistance transporter n=1 Tax=Salirhabdus euzebyi TaxID=394506 RepID=A0A841Q338_9BACI|nr:MDR family MFS transporter [Salirhabdus euzebyi]MBB6452458.1 EmrB/QacA subfamily drug resistance transporter [Salirhabdus euzebyi]
MARVLLQAGTPKTTKRTFVLIAIIIGMFMAAIEATIVATAMPSIVSDLGGFKLFSWVFSIYLLMQAVTIPIYGKLADLFGRKPVYVVGIIIFLVGSILCGFATTMPALIAFRFIQGIGAGAVQPIASTIVGDIYTIEERSKIQGYLASVWGISSIVGPALGALFVEYINWSWVYWINIPFGILSLIGIVLFLHEGVEKKKHSIDYIGSSLLFVSISALMLALIQGGVAWGWTSMPSLFLLSMFAIGMTLFILQETRAEEPMMPLGLWKNKIIMVSNLASLTTGMIMIGVISYIPTYVQGVMGYSAIVGGFSLAMMSIGWPISATIAGKVLIRLGYLKTAMIGGVSLLIGPLILITSQPALGPVWVAAGSFFVGVGMGFTTTTFVVSVQSSVEWKVRGVATASNMFMRILGNTVGISLMGGILNTRLAHYFQNHQGQIGDVDLDVTNALLDPEDRKMFSPETLAVLQEGLSISLHYVFWGLLVLGAISFALIWFLPNGIVTYEKRDGQNS